MGVLDHERGIIGLRVQVTQQPFCTPAVFGVSKPQGRVDDCPTDEEFRKHAVQRSGLLTVENVISVVSGIKPEVEGVGGAGLADKKVKFG